MSNAFSGVVREHYLNQVQENLEKKLSAMDLATMVDIPDGTTKNLPILDFQSVDSYTRYTPVTPADLNSSKEQIAITETPLVSFAIDDLDKQDNYIDVVPKAVLNAAYKLRESIDGNFFAEIANAEYTYSSTGLALTTGTETPLTLTTGSSQNVSNTFGTCRAHLSDIGADSSMAVIVADPFTVQKIQEVGIEKGFTVADENLQRGQAGRFVGMPVYESGLLKHTVVLDLATNPTAGDYVEIKGQRFNFVSSLGTTAGNIVIGASADATRAVLAAAINGGAGAGSTYVELTAKKRALFKNGVTATNDDSGNTLTIVSKRGSLRPKSVMTAAADDFRAEVADNAVLEKGAIHMALRKNVELEIRGRQDGLVSNYFLYSRYGLKTTASGKERMVRVAVETTAAEA